MTSSLFEAAMPVVSTDARHPKLNTIMGDNQINFICKDNAVTAFDHWAEPKDDLPFARNYPLC